MRIAAAQVPGIEVSDDCIYTTPNAVIMLDGASAFVPVQVPAALNAQHLGSSIQQRLASDLHADLTEVLGEAIANTADQLDLTPGHSPSSTVAIARQSEQGVDYLVLGDTQIAFPSERCRPSRPNTATAKARSARMAHGCITGRHDVQVLRAMTFTADE